MSERALGFFRVRFVMIWPKVSENSKERLNIHPATKMIEYQRDQQQTIPDSQVKIIGIGGAGANMIDRVALDGMEGAELLALNTDSRTLASSVAGEKIQLGKKLTKGLGCGGDPELGLQAAQEVETELRDSLRDRKMVFVCVGLGGGTGSGAAPLVTRVAREMGAFVVVFATMPFVFEGRRRREQAETALNELSVIANALVTFDNTRMGELVLAAQGIHDAFAAADRMISESIRAVTRLVIRPGIINVGLDDLMSALRTTRSRCLFGSGIARGENRSQAALKNALNSPLLDKGRLLRNAQTALVHICGGEGMTLFEVELLMRELTKNVPENAHILFGAAVDDSMGDSLSVTIISSLPESQLHSRDEVPVIEVHTSKPEPKEEPKAASAPASVAETVTTPEPEPAPEPTPEPEEEPEVFGADTMRVTLKQEPAPVMEEPEPLLEEDEEDSYEEESVTLSLNEEPVEAEDEDEEVYFEEETVVYDEVETPDYQDPEEDEEEGEYPHEEPTQASQDAVADLDFSQKADLNLEPAPHPEPAPKPKVPQGELALDGGPRGKFEGEAPNLFEGEDLDIPPFMRKKR